MKWSRWNNAGFLRPLHFFFLSFSFFSPSLILSSSSQITIEAMKSDIDEVALQGIEFWSNVCDEEMDLAIEASEVCVSRLDYINNF